MALIAIAADKGAPGVTTTALALAAVWPRPVLLAECDPAGGDLAYRFPAANGDRLDSRRGLLSLAVAARRGVQASQVWDHTQKLHGGLDLLIGVANAEQGTGLNLLWGPVGKALGGIAHADVIADCGRLGPDGPAYDLLAEAMIVVLVTRPEMGEVVRLRDRANAIAAAFEKRGRRGFRAAVTVVADQKNLKSALGDVGHVVAQSGAPASVVGGIADDKKAADQLGGGWGGKLEKSPLIRSAAEVAQQLVSVLPPLSAPGAHPQQQQAQLPPAQPPMPQAPTPQQPMPQPPTPARQEIPGRGRHSGPQPIPQWEPRDQDQEHEYRGRRGRDSEPPRGAAAPQPPQGGRPSQPQGYPALPGPVPDGAQPGRPGPGGGSGPMTARPGPVVVRTGPQSPSQPPNGDGRTGR